MNLKEFSAQLGLSPTTVSRALGGYPEVNERTRIRVAEAAKNLGYRPNQRARALATGQSYSIAHVLSRSNKNELVNPIFGDFISGATEASAAHGYDISLTVAEDGEEERVYRKFKTDGIVAGVVIQSPSTDDRRISLLKDIGLQFVVHGRASEIEVPYSWVDVNNFRALQRATNFLTDLGHRRIGLINGRINFDFAHRRLNGYLAGLASVGITADPKLQVSGDMTEANGYSAATEMLNLKEPATAFLASSVMSAIGVRRAVHDAGLTLGSDVSLIAYDDDLSYFANRESPPFFTALRSSVRNAGEEVVRMLLRKISTPLEEAESVLLEAELVVGTSTGPLRN